MDLIKAKAFSIPRAVEKLSMEDMESTCRTTESSLYSEAEFDNIYLHSPTRTDGRLVVVVEHPFEDESPLTVTSKKELRSSLKQVQEPPSPEKESRRVHYGKPSFVLPPAPLSLPEKPEKPRVSKRKEFLRKDQSSRQIRHESLQGLDWSRSGLHGRTDELSQLCDALELANNSVQTVLLTGPSGSGKSCLLEAFCDMVVKPPERRLSFNGSVSALAFKHHEQHNTLPPLICRAKFEEVAATPTDPFPTLIAAMKQLVDGLIERINLAEQQDHDFSESTFDGEADSSIDTLDPNSDVRQNWRIRLMEVLDSEIEVLIHVLPNLRHIVKADSLEQLVQEEEEHALPRNMGWTRHYSERLPRRSLKTQFVGTSKSTDLTGESSQSLDFSNFLRLKSESSTNSGFPSERSLSRWQQMSSLYGVSGSMRSQSDVQPRTTSRATFFSSSRANFTKDWRVDRLRLALRTLVRVISTKHTVVLALDDLQWADQQSVNLLETILSDCLPKRKLLFVGTMRVLGHNSESKCQSLQCVTDGNRTIFLNNLTKSAVSKWIQSLLRQDEEDVTSLVDVVHSKTAGNPFFIVQYLRLLNQQGLVYFSTNDLRWKWSHLKIQAETNICTNVLDVVVGKIRWLPQDQQLFLVIASCMGLSFVDVNILVHVLKPALDEVIDVTDLRLIFGDVEEEFGSDVMDSWTTETLTERLNPLVEQGLLEKLSDTMFKFSHDRVREAAYSFLSNEESKKKIHLRVGMRLREMIDTSPPAQRLSTKGGNLELQMVRQLNFGADLITDPDEKLDLAELNYRAAELAMTRSSFVPALAFLQQGIDLLGSNPWSKYHSIMEKLCISLSRMEYCCGRIDKSLKIADEVLTNARSSEAKIHIYHNKILCMIQAGRGEEALQLSLSVLEELGITFPRHCITWPIRREALKTRNMLRGKTDKELLDLPQGPKNRALNTKADFMEKLLEVSVHSQRPHAEYTELVLIRMMQLTLQHGCFSRTGCCFVYWGWYLASKGEFAEAIRYGKIGIKYAERNEGGIYDARAKLLFHYYVNHWMHSYYEGIEPVSKAIKKYWDAGAVELVHMETLPYLLIYFCSGLRLGPLICDVRRFTQLMKDYRQMHTLESSLPFFQMIANLMGESANPIMLSGEFMNEEAKEEDWIREGNENALQKLYSHKMMLAYYFGDYEKAWAYSKQLSSSLENGPDVWVPYRCFFEGMVSFAYYLKCHKQKFRRHGVSILNKFDKWVKKGGVNCKHMYLLLAAENIAASSSSKPEEVRRAYDTAISSAARAGFVNTQALANERAGLYFKKKGDISWAGTFFGRACDLYRSWGARAKADDILQMHRNVLELNETHGAASNGGNFRARTRLDLITAAHYDSLRLSRLSMDN